MNEVQVRQIFAKLSSLDKDEREKVHQALISVGLFIIPHILCAMLSEGLVDPDRAHNRDYLWSLLMENEDKIIPELQGYYAPHESFFEIAKYSTETGKPEVAVVLVATVIEHIVNMYYVDLLTYKGLPSKEINRVIRTNNFESKLGWLMQLTSSCNLPEELEKRIKELVEIRNAIVHYKPTPVTFRDRDSGTKETWDKIQERIQGLNLEDIVALPVDLEKVLDSMLDEIDPVRQKARDLFSVMLGSIG